MTRPPAAVLATLALLACAGSPTSRESAYEAKVVGWFPEHNEVFAGHARVDLWIQQGFIDLVSPRSGTRCVGAMRTTRQTANVSRPNDCDGAQGVIMLECSDDRRMRAKWRAGKACGAGYGSGHDEQGNMFRLAYGMSDETAALMTREALAEFEDRPPLPSAGAALDGGVRSGTAFFVSPNGHLVTSYHVVAGAQRIQVVLDGSEILVAERVADDEKNDLVVLRIDAIRPVLPIRRAHGLDKGEAVFALGYPLIGLQGREQKATFGRVNALTGLRGDERYTQVDVPIQPGNSGGPLLNRRGEVVGVVTAMLSQQATLEAAGVLPQNVNYALKSDLLHDLLRSTIGAEQLSATPEVGRKSFEELIRQSQDSVVIVLAEF